MLWTAAAVCAATGGAVLGAASRDTAFGSVATDSRSLCRGALFVPIRAERDGHDFIAAAMMAGAAGYLVEDGRVLTVPAGVPSGVAIVVPDTAAALLDLGRAARDRLSGPLVGITGSVGKTSTKDMLAAVMATTFRVTASPRSFNNELGVPLTLANAAADTEVTIVEMGARRIGHVAGLCRVARPSIGVVTAVAEAHISLFGSVEAIAVAKGELVEALPDDGTAVLNRDDPRVAAMAARSVAPVLFYSASGSPAADVAASELTIDGELRPAFVLDSPWGSASVRLEARGVHHVGNALAAAAVGLRCGVPIEAVAEALAGARLSPWRMELHVLGSGARVLNDAYNANPASTEAALRALAALPATRRVAVLGPMAELGAPSAALHREVAAVAADLGIELIPVDTWDYGPAPAAGADGAIVRLGPLAGGDAVLVKASRVAGLEQLAARLIGGGEEGDEG